VEDSVDKLYINAAGAEEVAADVASFVGLTVGYRCWEHVVHPVG
jgi:hypothetical protein